MSPDEWNDNTPTATLYDIFAETASELIGRYAHLSNTAATDDARTQWWEKVIAVRDARRAVPARDREALTTHIRDWRAEIEALAAAE